MTTNQCCWEGKFGIIFSNENRVPAINSKPFLNKPTNSFNGTFFNEDE